jgi:hypothetical protein
MTSALCDPRNPTDRQSSRTRRRAAAGAVGRSRAGAPDYDEMKKDELIALAEQRGIDSSGNKPDIIARLKGG